MNSFFPIYVSDFLFLVLLLFCCIRGVNFSWVATGLHCLRLLSLHQIFYMFFHLFFKNKCRSKKILEVATSRHIERRLEVPTAVESGSWITRRRWVGCGTYRRLNQWLDPVCAPACVNCRFNRRLGAPAAVSPLLSLLL
jgi:hypothetical protein